jgi:hypothetical protein
MDLKNVFLTTLIPEFPSIYSYNNQAFKRYLDVFYSETNGVIVAPINTPGSVKGATGQFVNVVTDNLTVKNQWTNLYDNYTTVDQDYYYAYIGGDVSTRDASTMGTQENPNFKYVDVNSPYYKISNDASTAFKAPQLGQEIQLIFDVSTVATGPFNILLNPSIGGTFQLANIAFSNAPLTWIKLIAVNYDASWGTTWALKQFGGTITLV